jgi:methionyl-tRNA formyltransferase
VSVVCCSTELWGARAYESARGRRDDWTLVTKPGELEKACADIDPTWVFFLHWPTKVKENVHGRWRCVGFHGTPLPYGRGGSPIENMLLRGHEATVITAYAMTDVAEGGPLYGDVGPVGLGGTRDEILARFSDPVSEMMKYIVRETPTPKPQDETKVVLFERLSPEATDKFWADPASAIAKYNEKPKEKIA